MIREKLAAQVKNEYARLASAENQQHFHNTAEDITPDAYYENLLGMVLAEIRSGTFDSFSSGKEVMEAVANDKSILTEWDLNDPRR